LRQVANSLKHSGDGMALAHAVREITEMLDEAGIGVVDLVGRSYDPGIVPEVLEVQIDPDLPEGSSIIEETVFPTVISPSSREASESVEKCLNFAHERGLLKFFHQIPCFLPWIHLNTKLFSTLRIPRPGFLSSGSCFHATKFSSSAICIWSLMASL